MKISIVIPTLNEANYLRTTILHSIQNAVSSEQLEMIVVDAGSSDNTLQTITDLPVTTFVDETFKLQKHRSLNFGLQQASGEVVLFLDADTMLPKNFDKMISNCLRNSNAIGGAFEMRFLNADFKLFLLSKLNSLRYNVWKTCYGDQAVFCTRKVAIELGGYQDTLMEAAHFCRALKKFGKLKIIKTPVLTSPRRFIEGGFWKVFWFDVKMWVRFVFRLEQKKSKTSYWKTNLLNG